MTKKTPEIPNVLHEITGGMAPGLVGRYEVLWRATGQRLPDGHFVLVPPIDPNYFDASPAAEGELAGRPPVPVSGRPAMLDAAVIAALNAHNYTFKVVDKTTREEVPAEQLPRVLIPARDPSAWWALRALAFSLEASGEVMAAKDVHDLMVGIPPVNGYGVK